MRKLNLFALAFLAVASLVFPCRAEDTAPSELLLKAMQPVPDYGRQQNIGSAIRELKSRDIVPFRPQRADYTDYYRVQKPFVIFGHQVVVVEEEYQSRFVGCCVSEGGGFVVRVSGNLDKLEDWANRNKCSMTEHDTERDFLQSASIRLNLQKGKYAEISCRIRDEE